MGVPIAASHWIKSGCGTGRHTRLKTGVRTSCTGSVHDTVHRYQVVLTLTLTAMTGVVHHDAAAVGQFI